MIRTSCFGQFFTFDLKEDFWPSHMVFARDTPLHDGKYLCQVILNSPNKWQSYAPDKLFLTNFLHLTLNCDDFWPSHMVLAHDTPSYEGEHLCQDISNSPNKWQSSALDKQNRTNGRKHIHWTTIVETMSISRNQALKNDVDKITNVRP